MNILLLGRNGQLGWELHRTLLPLGNVIAVDYPKINMADPKSIQEIVNEVQPNLIVNATAYTNVDKAESEHAAAHAINGVGPGILAQEARKFKAVFVHYSTDYVFGDSKKSPYSEEDVPEPINMYGVSKLEGEKAVQEIGGSYLIFRTSWVYSMRGNSFVTKVLKWAKSQDELRVVEDQISTPTWARFLAEATSSALIKVMVKNSIDASPYWGLYHLTDGGIASRYEWAKQILMAGYGDARIRVIPVRTDEFPTPAERPEYSVLNCDKFVQTFESMLPGWKNTLSLALENVSW
jgi:dTDP-4-dehydrorhamnose reductase